MNNKLAKVLGRVSMDMIAIDVTEIKDAKVEDVVTIIGEGMSAREVLKKLTPRNTKLLRE